MHIHQRALNILLFLFLLFPLSVFSQHHPIEIETDCLNLPADKAAGLRSMVQNLKNSGKDIQEAFDAMKNYYTNNSIPYSCSFTITCDECEGTSYMYFPIRTAKYASGEKLAVYGSRAGKYGDSDVEKLYSNELYIIGPAPVDIAPLYKTGTGDVFIEYTYKGKTYSKPLAIDDKQRIVLDRVGIYNNLQENEIAALDNKLYFLRNDKKRYISPRTFRLYFLNKEELENLKKAAWEHKRLFPDAGDEDRINSLLKMLHHGYGAIIYSDLSNWYYAVK